MIYHIVAIPAAWLLPHHWMVIFFVISTTKKMKSVGKDIKPTKIYHFVQMVVKHCDAKKKS